jgi:hypothetical protein
MCTAVGIPQVLAFVASVCPSISYPKEKEQQRHNRLPPMRAFSKLSRFFSTILGSMVCILANTEIATILPSNVLDGGRQNNRRELTTAVVYSFPYTGAVQTWYYPTFMADECIAFCIILLERGDMQLIVLQRMHLLPVAR